MMMITDKEEQRTKTTTRVDRKIEREDSRRISLSLSPLPPEMLSLRATPC
jgi:hypothetical protein